MGHAADRVIALLQEEGIVSRERCEQVIRLNRKLRETIEQLPVVELHPAHAWDCEQCGRENFSRCILAARDSDDDFDELLDEWDRVVTAPAVVECAHCKARYVVRDYDDPE